MESHSATFNFQQNISSMFKQFKVPSLITKNLNSGATSNGTSKNSPEKAVTIIGPPKINSDSVSNGTANQINGNSVKNGELNTNRLSGQPKNEQPRKLSCVTKPIKLKNIASKDETYDTLYARGTEVG